MFSDCRRVCFNKDNGFFDCRDWNLKLRSECGCGFVARPHTQHGINDASTAAVEAPLIAFKLDKLVGLSQLTPWIRKRLSEGTQSSG